MKSNRVSEFFTSYKSLEKKAERDHLALTHFEVAAQDVPSKALELLALYIKIIKHDCDEMRKKLKDVFCIGTAREVREFLLEKEQQLLNYSKTMTKEDMTKIMSPDRRWLKEYKHVQDFITLSREITAYVNSAEIYLGELHAELEKNGKPELINKMFGKNDADQGKAHFLRNFDKIIKIMKAGCDDADVGKFYAQQLEKIRTLGFVPVVPANAMKP